MQVVGAWQIVGAQETVYMVIIVNVSTEIINKIQIFITYIKK